RAADGYVPVREAVELADRRDDLAREEARVLASLARYVGLSSLAELAGDPPAFRVDPASLRAHLVHHAELARYGAELDQADAALREAVAARRPDWGLELAFQHRGPAFGDMVSLQFSFDLPVSPATRQDPLIDARRHDVNRLLAERDDMLRDHEKTLAGLLGRHASLGRQLERARATLLPALKRQVELLEAGYRAGGGELRELLDARRELIAARLRIVEIESRREVIAARLHFAYEETQS
ncbi:MAG: TolC family protein, partial [Gammaproteobacteria bacterium]